MPKGLIGAPGRAPTTNRLIRAWTRADPFSLRACLIEPGRAAVATQSTPPSYCFKQAS